MKGQKKAIRGKQEKKETREVEDNNNSICRRKLEKENGKEKKVRDHTK